MTPRQFCAIAEARQKREKRTHVMFRFLATVIDQGLRQEPRNFLEDEAEPGHDPAWDEKLAAYLQARAEPISTQEPESER